MRDGKPYLQASLVLLRIDLDPNLVTKELGMVPTRTRIRGVKYSELPQVVPAKKGAWEQSAQTGSPLVEVHIDEPLAPLRSRTMPLTSIAGVTESFLWLFIGDATPFLKFSFSRQ